MVAIEEEQITVEFLEKTSFGTAGVFNRGEVATFPKAIAEQLFQRHPRTKKVLAKPYVKAYEAPPLNKQMKAAPKKKGGKDE